MAQDDRLTVTQIAELYSVRPATFRAYVKRGQAPKADGYHDKRTPYWLLSTLSEWRPHPYRRTTSSARTQQPPECSRSSLTTT